MHMRFMQIITLITPLKDLTTFVFIDYIRRKNMNPKLTNEVFHEAWCSTPFHYAPIGYWEQKRKEMKKHPYVGRKACIYGKVLTCIRADYRVVVFEDPVKLSDGSISTGEVIVTADDVDLIKWMI